MAYLIHIGRRQFNLKSITVEPMMFFYMLTTFTSFLTYQALLYKKVCLENFNATICNNLGNETSKSQEDVVQKTTSSWLLYSNLAMGLPSLFSVWLFLGPWGDHVGRKLPIITPFIGIILQGVSNIVNSVFVTAPIGYLLIGQFLSGLCGGYIGAMMAMYSYIAHISTLEHKTMRMGVLEAMIFLSAMVGTALSGVILDNTSFVTVFIICLAVMTVGLIYGLLWIDDIIPEQTELAMKTSGERNCCQSVILDSMKDIFLCVNRERQNKNFWNIMWLIVIMCFLALITIGESDIMLVFTRHPPLKWSQTTLGLFRGMETFLRGIAILTILPLLKWRLKTRDTTLLLLGLVSKTAVLVVFGVGKKTGFLFIGGVLGVLQGFSSAAIRSMSSSMVQSHEQAKLFSLIAIIESLASLAATSLFNTVYSATLNFYSGFCFLMAAGMCGLLILIAIYLHIHLSGKQIYNNLDEEVDVLSSQIQARSQQNDDFNEDVTEEQGTIHTEMESE